MTVTRTTMLMGALVALFTLAPAPVPACCDWTPQDTLFWDKMYQNPQKFSYDMGARLTHFKLRNGGEEEVLTPESAQNDELWRHVLHHLHGSAAPAQVHDHPPAPTLQKGPRQ